MSCELGPPAQILSSIGPAGPSAEDPTEVGRVRGRSIALKGLVGNEVRPLCCDTLVSMVKPADLGKGNDSAGGGC